jgi:hypothetical protein
MLDLSFNSLAKFYEAPLHIKALSGTFVIDDFGRQIVKPEALLNRWIVPLGSDDSCADPMAVSCARRLY